MAHFARGLSKTKDVGHCIEDIFGKSLNVESQCRLLVYSLETTRHHHFVIPNWLSEIYFQQLESSNNTNTQTVETIIDSIFYNQPMTSVRKNLQPRNILADYLSIKQLNIHPAIITTLIVLCGGLNFNQCSYVTPDYMTPEVLIKFIPSTMYRSTAVSDIFLNYFSDATASSFKPKTRIFY